MAAEAQAPILRGGLADEHRDPLQVLRRCLGAFSLKDDPGEIADNSSLRQLIEAVRRYDHLEILSRLRIIGDAADIVSVLGDLVHPGLQETKSRTTRSAKVGAFAAECRNLCLT